MKLGWNKHCRSTVFQTPLKKTLAVPRESYVRRTHDDLRLDLSDDDFSYPLLYGIVGHGFLQTSLLLGT